MTMFWIMTGLMAAAAALIVLASARRSADRAEAPAAIAAAELGELDRLRTLGLLEEEAWTTARAEAGRRLLARTPDVTPRAAGIGGRRAVLAAVILTSAAALGVYLLTGTVGLSDAPYERRVDGWAQRIDTLEAPQLAAVAERVVRDRPGDREALTMLGAARFEAGDPVGSASAFRKALALNPEDARSWARLGEALTRAQEGVVGADAEAAFREALKRDPGQLGARYFLGEAALARGDAAELRRMWEPLIAALDPADARRADLEARLAGTVAS